MKTRINFIYAALIACACILSSCLSEAPGPNLSEYESYQISNTSSSDISLHFYEQGEPKTVYAEISEGSFVLDIESSKKSVDALTGDSSIILAKGQTALLYMYYEKNIPQSQANSLFKVGEGTSLQILNSTRVQQIMGDSIVMSVDGDAVSVLPVGNIYIWETWYDKKQYIYYHFLRLQ